ncbi:MAG: dodecin family protein [Candidatus Methylarchaceae archaeon HK02M1]|nr:dodecin family protein [Candidatus Methylarchaceae archaeon HK01M]MCP8311689.1 dodecin family protein [Candidatus Methylarchaceae archaeon HK02M1]
MVYKLIEVIGISNKDFTDAAKNAVEVAKKTIEEIRWVEVMSFGMVVKENEVVEYQAKTKIAFEVKRE